MGLECGLWVSSSGTQMSSTAGQLWKFSEISGWFLGPGWLALGKLYSGFSLVQRIVSIASWLLQLAKLADELIPHLGDQESERPMISKYTSREEDGKLEDRFIPVTKGELNSIKGCSVFTEMTQVP